MAGADADKKAVTLTTDEKPAEKKGKDGKKDKKKEEKLSEEDEAKKEQLDLLATRAMDSDLGVADAALQAISTELRTATASMTSVPKPLKFLRPHYSKFCEHYDAMAPTATKRFFADVLSVLSTSMAKAEERKSLKYRLQGTQEGLTAWGQEYMRNLSGEIIAEYRERGEKKETACDDLKKLVREIVPFNMKHHAEVDAVDLLLEMELIDDIVALTDSNAVAKVCPYVIAQSMFAATHVERLVMLDVALKLYMKFQQYPDALRVALKVNDPERVKGVFEACADRTTSKQMAYLISRQRFAYDFDEDEELRQIASGESLPEHFKALAKELDVMEPKQPNEIYKTHLEEKEKRGAALDSAKQNLASTFTNAFVNAGFCNDKLMLVEGSAWLYKNKEHGMMSAAASLGMLLLWDVDDGLTQIDKFQWSAEEHIKAGALMAFGMVTSGINNECDPAWALLGEHLESDKPLQKLGAIVGLGFAYAGFQREDLMENLTPIIVDTGATLECSVMAALSLGMIYVASCNDEIAQSIFQSLMERQAVDGALDGALSHFFAVGLGLLYLGQQDKAETILEALEAITHPIGKYARLTVETCAYAGSGDVLKIQRLLHECAEHLEEKDAVHQGVAVLGIPLIAMGEEIGTEMCLRSIDHILQYGAMPLRRAVPLALGLMCVSDPSKIAALDTLSKLSHDADSDTALAAIFSMGLMGAGTNNSRLAGMLRQLAGFYAKDANALFMVRISQGLLHMGKGLVTLNPLHSDRLLMAPTALAALVVLTHSCLHLKSTFLGNAHYLLFHVVSAMYPRMLITLDEDLQPLPVNVRVGQAVDTAGQAGKPKQITGFQTHTTPVLISSGERAELATEEYISASRILEGIVILRKNPDYKAESKD